MTRRLPPAPRARCACATGRSSTTEPPMRRCTELAAALALAAACLAPPALARTLVHNGEVRATNAQQIITPSADSSPVVVRYLLTGAELVRSVDVVLR